MTVLSKTKSHFKLVPFEIYASFEFNLESLKSNDSFCSKKYQSDNLT